MKYFKKDPDATLDFSFDWSDWLESSETISSYTVTVDSGITKDSDSQASGIVTVWLKGGTAGQSYSVACKITTSDSRIDERTIEIFVTDR